MKDEGQRRFARSSFYEHPFFSVSSLSAATKS